MALVAAVPDDRAVDTVVHAEHDGHAESVRTARFLGKSCNCDSGVKPGNDEDEGTSISTGAIVATHLLTFVPVYSYIANHLARKDAAG